jgi:cytochrome P450 family 142 subfamily A polypeptide 1
VTAPPRINVLDPLFYVDPSAAYQWLRDQAPVFWDPVQQVWVISRYEDIVAVERDSTRYSSFAGSRPHIDQRSDGSMINLDEPDHKAQRNLIANRFTFRGVRSHEDRVRQVVKEILSAVAPLGECEAIEAIASRLPAMMTCDLLGYPPELWERVRWWSERVMLLAGQTSPEGPPHVPHHELPSIMQDWAEVTLELIEQRRIDPKDDLISLWVHTEGWSTKKVLDETVLVLDGGAETTRTVIGSIIRELALHPEQRQLLIDQPELLSTTAVEEFIRWVSPIVNMRRTATEDHTLRDQHIRQGDQLLLLYASANSDPRAFEGPEVFDVTRGHNRHVAFGFGTHFCLGAHLARLEIRIMFEELLLRLPDWELIDPDEPVIMPASFARAYDRVRIRFTPAPAPTQDRLHNDQGAIR